MHDASDKDGVRGRGSARSSQASGTPRILSDGASHDTVAKNAPARTLGIVGMVIFTFVSTSAGPFGIEGMVSASGPICTVCFVFLVPLVLVTPIILMLTELAAWMPSNHGSVRWVHRAFGPFAGFVNGIFQCAMNMLDLAVYPVMSTNYICRAFWQDATHWDRVMLQSIVAVAGAIPCMLRIKGVVGFCLATSVIILIPFVVGVAGTLKKADPAAWTGRFTDSPNFATLLSTGLWLYNGFVGNSSVAGEVTGYRVFLWGQLGAVVIDVAMYMLPLLVTLQVEGSWGDAFLVTAFNTTWPGLGKFISLAGAASGYGLYLSSMACYARTLWGAGDMRWVPPVFGRLHGGAPRVAVGFLMLTSIGFGMLGGFSFLVDLEFVIASVIYILFAASFIVLRYRFGHEPRPYIVPGGKITTWLLPAPLIIFMFGMFGSSVVKWQNAVGFLCTTVITAGLYKFLYRPYIDNLARLGITPHHFGGEPGPEDDVSTEGTAVSSTTLQAGLLNANGSPRSSRG
mmetsp:Transcript_7027/g.22002  ORF Transcript_7027/g.22002 Transcript_7027/m.22002 type:complete len:512 (-) Transcript_7027:105-1640(-)